MGKRNVVTGRQSAAIEGEHVVFMLGMRINRLRAVRRWLAVILAMGRMQRELAQDPEIGLLGGSQLWGPGWRQFTVIQYWRGFEELKAYAADPQHAHRPAWRAFNERARASGGAVGVWHETYLVGPGRQESVYVDMPPTLLGRATGVVPIARRGERAAERLGRGPAAEPSSTLPV